VEEEYCWTTEQVAECSCYGRADSSVVGITNSAGLSYVYSRIIDDMYT